MQTWNEKHPLMRRSVAALLLCVLALTVPGDVKLFAADDDELGELEKMLSSEGPQKKDSTTTLNELDNAINDEGVEEQKPAETPERKPSVTQENLDELILDEPVAPVPQNKETNLQPQNILPVSQPAPNVEPANIVPAVSTPAQRNQITNLEFRMEGQASRILITSAKMLQFREVRNTQVNQVVYFFANTETSQKLQRAYDTTEFHSPIGLFTLVQMPKNNPPLTKLIIQLREPKAPSVVTTDRSMIIEFGPLEKDTEQRIVIGGDPDGRIAEEENIYSGNHIFKGRPIKLLNLKNADIQDALRLVAKTSGFNIVIGEDVSGRVGTLSLENVPWDQAFALILQSKKLGYVKQGNVIRVGTLGSLKNEKEEAHQNELSKIRVEPLRTVLIPVSYAKAADLASQAKSFLTERGSIDVDPRTNTVIVKDVDKTVTRIQKLYAALDTQPPRVSIEARFVEMTQRFTRTLGFSGHNLSQSFGGINVTQGFLFASSSAANSTTTINAANFANLTSSLLLGELNSEVRVLASPAVTTLANKNASIQSSQSFFVESGNVSAGGIITLSVTQIVASLQLDVTPIVAGDGTIMLTINLKNDVPNGGSGQALQIEGRNIRTDVLLENGDTAVLGGIYKTNIQRASSGVPFLMNIPLIGFFFSHRDSLDDKSEISAFITARIMNSEEAFRSQL